MTSGRLRLKRASATTAMVVALALLAGCTATSEPNPNTAPDDVTSSLGAVPIPTAPAVDPVPTAVPGTPQLLAMGAPTIVILGPGSDGTATATGPEQTTTLPTTSSAEPSTDATITLTVATTHGSIVLDPADLVCRDETGTQIQLTQVASEPAGPTTVAEGTTGVVMVTGHLTSGAAQLTWRPSGKPIAIWDFNIELD